MTNLKAGPIAKEIMLAIKEWEEDEEEIVESIELIGDQHSCGDADTWGYGNAVTAKTFYSMNK